MRICICFHTHKNNATGSETVHSRRSAQREKDQLAKKPSKQHSRDTLAHDYSDKLQIGPGVFQIPMYLGFTAVSCTTFTSACGDPSPTAVIRTPVYVQASGSTVAVRWRPIRPLRLSLRPPRWHAASPPCVAAAPPPLLLPARLPGFGILTSFRSRPGRRRRLAGVLSNRSSHPRWFPCTETCAPTPGSSPLSWESVHSSNSPNQHYALDTPRRQIQPTPSRPVG